MKKQALKTSAKDINHPCEQLPEVRLTKKESKIFMTIIRCIFYRHFHAMCIVGFSGKRHLSYQILEISLELRILDIRICAF